MTQSEIFAIRKQAKDQKEQKNWQNAEVLYEKIYSPHCDRWIAWEYSDCLKKLARLDKAISVSKELLQRDKQFCHNNIFLSWLLYEKYFKTQKDEFSSQDLNHLYEIAISITTFTAQDTKSAYESTVLKMLKLLKKQSNNPASKILTLLEKLDIEKLSEEVGKYEQYGREKEYQSKKEMFFAMKSKALLDCERYAECISCCDEALSSFEQFHHDNKIWIMARKAVSMAKTGSPDEAILELNKAVVYKNHWSLFAKIAEIYLVKQDSQSALLYFSMAAISKDPPKMKVTLYMDMANLLHSMGDEKNSWKHLCIAKNIREKEQWIIPSQMQQLYQVLFVHQYNEMVQLYQLKEYWLSIIYRVLGEHSGVISKVNHGGKTGFISSQGNSYFFRASSFFERPSFKEKEKVTFCLIESYDIKKQRFSFECGYIKFDK